jgi:hypothetical protein
MQRFVKGCLASALLVAAMMAAAPQAHAGGGFNVSINLGRGYPGYYPGYRSSFYGSYGPSYGGPRHYGAGWHGGGSPYGYRGYGGYGGYGGGYGHCNHSHRYGSGW